MTRNCAVLYAIMYEPTMHEVYSMNGRGQNATVIDAKSGAVIATIPLGGKPESAVADADANRVYVNIEDKNSIAVIDSKTHRVVANWPIAPGEEVTGSRSTAPHIASSSAAATS